MATKVKVQTAEKTHERVWNVTDDPRTEVDATVLMVVGKTIAPGQNVRVPLSRLGGKRLEEMKRDKVVFVGPKPPQDYLVATNRLHVKLAPGFRSHGDTPEKKKNRAKRMAALRAKEAKQAAKDKEAADKKSLNEVASLSAERDKRNKADARAEMAAKSARVEEAKVAIKKVTGKAPELKVTKAEEEKPKGKKGK